MDASGIAKTLTGLGVDPQAAAGLQKRMDGRDLTNLVNALNFVNSSKGRQQTETILRKYGITLNRVKEMTQHSSHLVKMFNDARGGLPADDGIAESIAQHLLPIEESKDPIAHMLALEGYNYEANVENTTVGSKLIDWLEENLVDYQTNGAGQFQIKCPDRDHAYRVSSAISRITSGAGRSTVNDSAGALEEKSMSKKKAPTQVPTIKPQNVMKTAGRMATGAGSHRSSDPERKDAFSRKAKHKSPQYEDVEYSLGETVMVGDREATVKIPHGPNGTVGVIMDGELTMLDRNEINLTEGVMGMTGVNPLFRLRELAGLPALPTEDPAAPQPGEMSPLSDVEGDSMPDMDDSTMGGDIDVASDFDGDTMGAPDMDGAMGDDMGAVDGIDGELDMPMGDLDTGMDSSIAPQMGGMPGDLPPVMDAMPVAPVQSEAYASIEDSLNQVQSMLGDVKLSEYRTLVKKLEDLANQVRNMGRDYLGEQNMRAKRK